jgi:hypothetical protein
MFRANIEEEKRAKRLKNTNYEILLYAMHYEVVNHIIFIKADGMSYKTQKLADYLNTIMFKTIERVLDDKDLKNARYEFIDSYLKSMIEFIINCQLINFDVKAENNLNFINLYDKLIEAYELNKQKVIKSNDEEANYKSVMRLFNNDKEYNESLSLQYAYELQCI